jgi:CRP-like cAMP-binding protein
MDVFRDGAKLGPLHVGEHFGEMSLIRSQPRSASVIAAERSELLVLQRVDFFELLRSYPRISVKLLWQFTAALADRMEELMSELALLRVQKPRESFIGDDVFTPEDYDRQTLEVPFLDDPNQDPSLEVGWHSSSYPSSRRPDTEG